MRQPITYQEKFIGFVLLFFAGMMFLGGTGGFVFVLAQMNDWVKSDYRPLIWWDSLVPTACLSAWACGVAMGYTGDYMQGKGSGKRGVVSGMVILLETGRCVLLILALFSGILILLSLGAGPAMPALTYLWLATVPLLCAFLIWVMGEKALRLR
ncbi:MAG: hypothetical protein AB8F34_14860 [Akkermansiaceae bacterium]